MMRKQVLDARAIMHRRQGTIVNAQLRGAQLDEMMQLSDPARVLLEQAMTQLGLSARGYDKVRRVSRTIADVSGSEDVKPEHVGEAVQYRLLDRRV